MNSYDRAAWGAALTLIGVFFVIALVIGSLA